jgi:uncharacterized protein
MKLHADKPDVQTVTAYGEGWLAIDGQRHQHSLVLSSSGRLAPWNCARFDALTADHFDSLLVLSPEPPEVVVFGSGVRLRFLRPSLIRGLIERRIGIETMDTAAACRTYNILAGEGRRVVAALLLET